MNGKENVMEYYLILKKREMLHFTTTWMKLEDTMLSETSQIGKNTARLLGEAKNKRKKEKLNI